MAKKPPPRTLTLGKNIDKQAKLLVYHVYTYFKEQKIANNLSIKIIDEVVNATGISRSSVKRIASEGNNIKEQGGKVTFNSADKKKKGRKKRIDIDNFDVGVIRRKINQFYTDRKELPTIQKINIMLKNENVLDCSREYLRILLHKIGFKYSVSQSKKKLLTERSDIIASRWHYLKMIKKYRSEQRNIYFLDETYVNQSATALECWHSDLEQGVPLHNKKEPRLIIMHAGGRNGFVNGALTIFESNSKSGDYQGEMDANNFERWVVHQLLPNLPSHSVVVMDNAECHSTEIDKKPTMSATKSTMQEYLKLHNIPFQTCDRKCELLKLIDNHNTEKQYKIDSYLKENGHEVLRIPPYHPDLNPIEIVWGDVKSQLVQYTESKLNEKKEALKALLSNFTAEKWQICDDHVKNIEDQYYSYDLRFDDAIDEMITSVGGVDSSTDESSSCDSDSDS